MMHCGYFNTARKGNYTATLTQAGVGGDAPFLLTFALKDTHPL